MRKVSPGTSVAAKSSSISPSAAPLPFIRTESFSVSTIVPTFIRIVRARRGSRSRQRPSSLDQPLPAVVGAQRVAAGGAELEAIVEVGPRQRPVRSRAPHLVEERIGRERAGAGGEQDLLAEHVEPAGSTRLAVEIVREDRVERRAALEHLEAVRRHQHRPRWRVVAVVGAADPLHQPLDVLRRTDLHHEVDVAPVDAEVERAGGDDPAELPPRPSPPRPACAPRG